MELKLYPFRGKTLFAAIGLAEDVVACPKHLDMSRVAATGKLSASS